MILDVQVSGKTVAQLYRERDEYVLKNVTIGRSELLGSPRRKR